MRASGLIKSSFRLGSGSRARLRQRGVRRYGTSGLPPEVSASGIAALTSRRLLSVSGPDAAKYLQGVITSSIASADAKPRSEGFYTGFLSAQGRVLHDAFIFPDTITNGDKELGQAFLIEVDADEAQRLERHIRRYKLRAKFDVRLLGSDEATVWHAWDDHETASLLNTPNTPNTPSNKSPTTIRLRDPRTPTLGTRLITRTPSASPPTPNPDFDLDLPLLPEQSYTLRRYLHGVPEGQAELAREAALPLESNLDAMGAVDFRKGCYVGQELTIRTRHRGVVRKRVLPCVLYGEARAAPAALAYRPEGGGAGEEEGEGVDARAVPFEASIGRVGKKGRSAGRWLRGMGNVGLALCRLETMTDLVLPGETAAAAYDPEKEFVMTGNLGGDGGTEFTVKIKAFVPEWLRERLAEQTRS